MTPLTEAEVAELERLEKAATRPTFTVRIDDTRVLCGPNLDRYEEMATGDIPELETMGDGCEGYMTPAIARLVAALCNSAPQLLAAWRRCQEQEAEIARLRGALEKIANAPACGPGGHLYYEVTSDDGQVCMDVDPIGWIGSAATIARAALAGEEPKG